MAPKLTNRGRNRIPEYQKPNIVKNAVPKMIEKKVYSSKVSYHPVDHCRIVIGDDDRSSR